MSTTRRSGAKPKSSERPDRPNPSQKPRPPAGQATRPGRLTRQESYRQRQEERQREEARRQREARIKRGVLWGGAALVAVLILVGIVHAVTSRTPTVGNIPGVVTYTNLSRDHVSGTVNYPQNPPVGGPHNPVWLNCGIYDYAVPNENAVHSLEHGAVWITYQPNLPAADVTRLVNLVKGHSYVILSPYPGLPAPVVASAWGVQLKVQSASDSRIAEFIQKYEQGPQTPEPGAPCSGGTGAPIA